MKFVTIQENTNGKINVSYKVIGQIAYNSLLNTPGIVDKEIKILSKIFNNDTKNTKIKIDNDILEIIVNIKVIYGINVLTVAKNVQEIIHYNVNALLNINNFKVNVLVDSLVIDKKYKD